MNRSKLFIITGFFLLSLASCADEDLAPIVTFDSVGKGAYVRLIKETEKFLNLFDIPGSIYTYSVEFVDIEKGAQVTEYNLDVVFKDNSPSNGNSSKGPIRYKSFPAGEFKTTDAGFKGLSDIRIPLTELITAVGLKPEDVRAGDIFTVVGGLVLMDGAVYKAANSSAAVRGSAFKGHFDFGFTAGCPSSLAGKFKYVSTDYFCPGDALTGEVSIVSKGGGVYSFDDWSFGSYVKCYSSPTTNWGTLAFTDVCKEVSFTGRVDSFGDTWTFTSSVSGTEWTIDWINTYGEKGKTVITNPAGWGFITK